MTNDLSCGRIINIVINTAYWIDYEWPTEARNNVGRIKEVVMDNVKTELKISYIPPSLEIFIIATMEAVFNRINGTSKKEMKEALRSLLTTSAQ